MRKSEVSTNAIAEALRADRAKVVQLIQSRIDLKAVAVDAMHEMIDLDQQAIVAEMVRLARQRTKESPLIIEGVIHSYLALAPHVLNALKILYEDQAQ